MKKGKAIPDFRSKAEEREFWDTHDPREYMTEPVDVIWDIRPQRKKRATLRLETSLIVELKSMANGHGTRYQTLARGLVKRGTKDLVEV